MLRCAAAVTAVSLLFASCGGSDDEAKSSPPASAPTTLLPHQAQAPPNLPSFEGYLVSASSSGIVLRTADGRQELSIDGQDAPRLGIEHLQSHAGDNTVGFRIYYEQQGGRRFVKQAMEIPPTALK